MQALEHALKTLMVLTGIVVGIGVAAAALLRIGSLRWTWALPGLVLAAVVFDVDRLAGLVIGSASLLACVLGASWHGSDLGHGADLADAARARLGMLRLFRRHLHRRRTEREGWISDGRLTVGRDDQGLPVSIPVGYESGSHTLVLGATGSGKTVSEAWIACRLIEEGHGAIVVDPKGDRMLHQELQAAAARRGARFLEWTPEGPLAYNPYAQGSDTEIADKALSGETFTEPHYLRQAQRYLGHAIRVMHAAGVPVTPVSLMKHLDPGELEFTARQLPDEGASVVLAYLDSLTDRQRRDLAGVRDRLSILAESDASEWLDPRQANVALDIQQAVQERAVVYFRLDSDRRPLLAGMLAAAIVGDLIALVARLQANPIPTVVVIDEFSAVAADQVARLFGRARSAGVSLILGTQELADLKTAADGLREQTLGNVATVIAHRQNVPESAELIAATAGTKPVWVTTEQTEDGFLAGGPSGRGSRRRGYEYEIHPSQLKRLRTGFAAVITPGSGQRPVIARMCHPSEVPPRRR
ncbi:MAG TPA: TraM recognition domain-containing protein [Solirubrobacteraceae bacterium]|nr:TraM recognition domain-containing protein [Solirubrobacteraceae bacterium]